MRILLLNHYIPPDPAPTGRLIGELAEVLRENGWDAELVSGSRGGYRDSGAGKKSSKLLGWLRAHLLVIWRGIRAPRADLVLCLTDPPFLPLTASVIARFHRARLAHWCMDLYPELAIELDEVPHSTRPIVRQLGKLMQRIYRSSDPLVALDEAMAGRLAGMGGAAERGRIEVIPPWVQGSVDVGPEPSQDPDRFTWLYSGNLGRAHVYETLLQAQMRIEEADPPVAIELVFQGRGALREEAEARANELGLKRCIFRDYAPEAELVCRLREADLLVVTLDEALSGMLWPSKMALLKHLERGIVWVGPAGEISDWLESRKPDSAAFRPGDGDSLADWVLTQSAKKARLSGGQLGLESVHQERREACLRFEKILRRAVLGCQ